MPMTKARHKNPLRIVPEITEQNRRSFCFDKTEPKARVEFSAIVRATTGEAGDNPSNSMHTRERCAALRTFVNETSRAPADGKWQLMATLFAIDAKIATGSAPLDAVRSDAPISGPGLRKQVRQFVSQRLLNFRGTVFVQTRVQRDEFSPPIGASGASFQTRIPFHVYLARGSYRAVTTQ